MTTARIPPERSEPSAEDAVAWLMELTGDIAVLSAGSRLADENRSGHQCFVILDGAAVEEREGTRPAPPGERGVRGGRLPRRPPVATGPRDRPRA